MGIFDMFKISNTAYFPGCITYFKYKEIFELYQKIFRKLGINYRVLDKKICSGLPALEAGYEAEARKLARQNFELFKDEGIAEIITMEPGCYKMFNQDYGVLLPDWDLKVINIWEIIAKKLENKPRLIKYKAMELVTYHDSCYLGRYSEIYDEVRRILELIGYEIKEMDDHREKSMCCGSCGGLPRTNHKLAGEIAKERVLQAKRKKVSKMIVASVENYDLLRKNVGDSGIEILELSEVLAFALGIKIRDKKEPEEEEIDGERAILEETKANMKLEEEIEDEEYYDNEMRGVEIEK